jgi:hypothetical protein
MKFLKDIFAGIGIMSVLISSGIVGKMIIEQPAYAEDGYQEDVDPQLIHYRTQYFQLLNDYDMLREENDLLKMELKYNEDKIVEPNYDLDGDGVVTICDAVKLMKFLAEMEG